MTPEAKTKAAIRKMLETSKVYFFMPAANGFGRAGIPDFIACVKGCFLGIEAKAGKGRTTALQDRELQSITDHGGVALVVSDKPEDMARLQEVINNMKEMNGRN